MFRLWGKLWKDNHMLKDLVIDETQKIQGHTRSSVHCRRSAMILTWKIRSGWTAMSRISNAIPEHGSARTVLLNILNLITWRFR